MENTAAAVMNKKDNMITGPYILVVEDDMEDQEIMKEAFAASDANLDVRFVNDGDKVIPFLKELGDNNYPDLITLDINMPRISGLKVLELLKTEEALSRIPVVIFSSSLDPSEMRQAKKNGAREYIVKPNSFNEYIDIADVFSTYCRKVA